MSVTFKPTPNAMRLMMFALGDAVKMRESSLAVISIDPGTNCAFMVQVFHCFNSDRFVPVEDYVAESWVTKLPMRDTARGKKRSYVDGAVIAKSVDRAMLTALNNSKGPVDILFVIEDNGGPIGPGIQAAWTMAECIGCLKGCIVNTASLVNVGGGAQGERIDGIHDTGVRPSVWVRELGLTGTDKAERSCLVHRTLHNKHKSGLPKELHLNEHQVDAWLIGLYGGLSFVFEDLASLMAAVVHAEENANAV